MSVRRLQHAARHHASALVRRWSATIKRYGILNTVVEEGLGPNGKNAAVLGVSRHVRARPAGTVTSRFFEDYYWERHSVSNILMRLGTDTTPVQPIQGCN